MYSGPPLVLNLAWYAMVYIIDLERYEYDGDDDDIYNLAGKAGLVINMIFAYGMAQRV